MYRIAAAMSEDNEKLTSMGYKPVYCGTTSLEHVTAHWSEHATLADDSPSIHGRLYGSTQKNKKVKRFIACNQRVWARLHIYLF